jgi:dephospho-CoA kinase
VPLSELYGVTSKETGIKRKSVMEKYGQNAKKAQKLERETKEAIKQNTG